MKLEGKATQFFTNEKEYLRAKELGIDMKDSYFAVIKCSNEIVVKKSYTNPEPTGGLEVEEGKDYYPIYTLSEILYKLPEWIGKEVYMNSSIIYLKDAPFYGFCLYTEHDRIKSYTNEEATQEDIDARIECINEYPIRSAMQMLFECAKNPNLWYVKDVSDK